jgi:hypothetical protein
VSCLTELISNGDFSNGTTDWTVNGGTLAVTNGQLCTTAGNNANAIAIWPDNGATKGTKLASGETYTLSYQATVTAGSVSQFVVTVGQAVSPYNADAQFNGDKPATTQMTFTHTFTMTTTDFAAGLAFSFVATGSGATVCLDNVSLTGP